MYKTLHCCVKTHVKTDWLLSITVFRGKCLYFYALLTVHPCIIFFKWSQLGALYFLVYLFQLLYMFRAAMWTSSGELTVSMRHWYFSFCMGCFLWCWFGWDCVAVWCAGWDETGWLYGVLVGMRLGGSMVCWFGWDCVTVRCAGWDETGWLYGVLVGMRLCGCMVCWLGWDWVAVWCAGWDETGWLYGVLVGMRLSGCMVCWLGWDWVARNT